jgi:hypothetical protein
MSMVPAKNASTIGVVAVARTLRGGGGVPRCGAVARREREHRPEHLALALAALDPGAAWVLTAAGVDAPALLADLATAFPPPRRNPLLRAERRCGQRLRHHDLVRRYQHTTGRTATTGSAVAALIHG